MISRCYLYFYSSFRLTQYKLRSVIWRPSSLSESTPIVSYMEFTHLGSKAFISFKISFDKTKHLYFWN